MPIIFNGCMIGVDDSGGYWVRRGWQEVIVNTKEKAYRIASIWGQTNER